MTALILPATACALIYLPMSPRAASLSRSLAKTLSVALLALAAAVAGAPWPLVAALVLCALGDALLAQETEATFMAGIAAFALGHLAYAALFLSLPASDLSLLLDAPLPLLALVALGLGAAALLAPRAGDLRGPVLAYIPIILAMGLAALTLPRDGATVLILPAALSFIASDLILATEKFLLHAGHPLLRVTPYLVWPLYWLAQLGFVLAFI